MINILINYEDRRGYLIFFLNYYLVVENTHIIKCFKHSNEPNSFNYLNNLIHFNQIRLFNCVITTSSYLYNNLFLIQILNINKNMTIYD